MSKACFMISSIQIVDTESPPHPELRMPSLVILLYVVFENVLWVIDELKWTAVAIVDLNGGGPEGMHSHPHNHLFIVTSGEARVEYEDETVIIHENEAFVVEDFRPHAVWNNLDGRTVMVGITLTRK